MRQFRGQLAAIQAAVPPRPVAPGHWWWLAYDQLNPRFLPPEALQGGSPAGVILVEHPGKAARRPYHRQKLALLLSHQRHFALELAAQGVALIYAVVPEGQSYLSWFQGLDKALGPISQPRPAERELRAELQPAVDEGRLVWHAHPGWLTTSRDFAESQPADPPWRMEAFYRQVRRRTGVLMTEGPHGPAPMGDRYSFDDDNRQPWRGQPKAPRPPRFVVDEIAAEVGALIRQRYSHHPGELDLGAIPHTAAQVHDHWRWALGECLPLFGPYEDAMSTQSWGLFHTRISPLLNLHRLWPAQLLDDVLAAPLPLPSQEGFVRQLLGWREYVHHVHEVTDGLRQVDEEAVPLAQSPGDGGWQQGLGHAAPWPSPPLPAQLDGGAAPNLLGAQLPVPPAFWGKACGLNCLDHTVAGVWREGYSHHITRLMILGNIATLLGVSPRALSDWFWVAYIDAYDWVVEPNVLGMASFALGPAMTTKPYVSGAAYVQRMSDFCHGCAFDPKRDCPLTPLYWAFLARHAGLLQSNARTAAALASLNRRSPAQLASDEACWLQVRDTLMAGQRLTPQGQADQPPLPGFETDVDVY